MIRSRTFAVFSLVGILLFGCGVYAKSKKTASPRFPAKFAVYCFWGDGKPTPEYYNTGSSCSTGVFTSTNDSKNENELKCGFTDFVTKTSVRFVKRRLGADVYLVTYKRPAEPVKEENSIANYVIEKVEIEFKGKPKIAIMNNHQTVVVEPIEKDAS